MKKTFYCYDDTFNAYDNAKEHVHSKLLELGIETDIKTYSVSNDHPAGYDCIEVGVLLPDSIIINSFMGDTKYCGKGDVWFDPRSLVCIIEQEGMDIHFDGDRMCGVHFRPEKVTKKTRPRRI